LTRIIFSRKGFDSEAGGCPSPIIEGRAISLPIPTGKPTPFGYVDLRGDYGVLVEDLTKGKVNRYSRCHLDPDIDASVLRRLRGWRGAFGQVDGRQTHLSNHGVTTGDLFLFWGLFQHAERRDCWTFYGPREHRLFGWLQIGEILELGEDGSFAVQKFPWLRDHPHVRKGWSQQNVLYIASDELRLNGAGLGLSGSGVFRRGFSLTADRARSSIWSVPDWLNPVRGGVGMTFHPDNRWNADGTVAVTSPGQEFVSVTGGRSDAMRWLNRLFSA
jgi:Nucleotide modification associated domain 3